MDLAKISEFLNVYQYANGYKFENGLWLKIQKVAMMSVGPEGQHFTSDEIKEMAKACYHLKARYERACGTISRLASDNQRLEHENEFMLRLINSRMKDEDI